MSEDLTLPVFPAPVRRFVPNPAEAPIYKDIYMAPLTEGEVVLGYLIVLRKVRIEVVLPVELAEMSHLAVEGEPRSYGELHGLFIQNWEHPGEAQAHRTSMRVWRGSEIGAAPAEDLGLRQKLHVYLEPYDDFVILHSLHP